MGNPGSDSTLQKTGRALKQAEKVGDGIHELTGVVGFFHPAGSIAHGTISLGLALGNYMNAGIHGWMALYYDITGDEEEEKQQRKIVKQSMHKTGEHMKDVAWDAVFLIPFTRILTKLGKVLKVAKQLLSFSRKFRKFEKLTGAATSTKEKAAFIEKKLIDTIEKEYGPIVSECVKNFKKWTFPSYKETIQGWKKAGKANPHEVFEFVQSIIGQIKFICDSIEEVYETFENKLPDWLRSDADKEIEKLLNEAEKLEKELDELPEEQEDFKVEEEEYEEVYLHKPEEKYYAMDDQELDESIRQSGRDKKKAEARAEEADINKTKYEKDANKYARKETEAQKRMEDAESRKIAAYEEATIAEGAEAYYQSLADNTADEKKKAEYQKKADDAAKKKANAEKRAEKAESDRAQASNDMQSAATSKGMAQSYADFYDNMKQQAEDDAFMAEYEKKMAKQEKKDRVGADERIAAAEEVVILESQLDIYKSKYNQAKSDEVTAAINGWGQEDIKKAKKEQEKYKKKMEETQKKIDALNRKARN